MSRGGGYQKFRKSIPAPELSLLATVLSAVATIVGVILAFVIYFEGKASEIARLDVVDSQREGDLLKLKVINQTDATAVMNFAEFLITDPALLKEIRKRHPYDDPTKTSYIESDIIHFRGGYWRNERTYGFAKGLDLFVRAGEPSILTISVWDDRLKGLELKGLFKLQLSYGQDFEHPVTVKVGGRPAILSRDDFYPPKEDTGTRIKPPTESQDFDP